VAGSCDELANEPLGSIKGREFFDNLSDLVSQEGFKFNVVIARRYLDSGNS
jgi:hypothetical protein